MTRKPVTPIFCLSDTLNWECESVSLHFKATPARIIHQVTAIIPKHSFSQAYADFTILLQQGAFCSYLTALNSARFAGM